MHIRLVKLYSVQGKVVMNKLSFNRQCKPCHLTKFVTFFSANLLGSILHIIIILPVKIYDVLETESCSFPGGSDTFSNPQFVLNWFCILYEKLCQVASVV